MKIFITLRVESMKKLLQLAANDLAVLRYIRHICGRNNFLNSITVIKKENSFDNFKQFVYVRYIFCIYKMLIPLENNERQQVLKIKISS